MPSKLSEELSPFYVMEVLERAREIETGGGDVIHFEVGEPDFRTPDSVAAEAARAIEEGDTKYVHSMGIPELRSAVASHYERTYGVTVSPSRVAITMGSSPALFLAIISHIEPGDEVLITDPHYACYPQIIKIAGGVPLTLRIYEDEGYQIDATRLEKAITDRTRAILINSPANPTGALLTDEVMRNISGRGLYVISDEIYHGLVYSGRARSILEFTENACVVNGFSKYYSMTGWRLGYLIVPPGYTRAVQKLQQNMFISANPFIQRAGVVALRTAGSDAAAMALEFDIRRRAMVSGLRELGFKLPAEPGGAFYVFADASHIDADSYALAFDILENAGVAVTPGTDFGEGGRGYLRFSYANSVAEIEEGIRRIGVYLKNREGAGS